MFESGTASHGEFVRDVERPQRVWLAVDSADEGSLTAVPPARRTRPPHRRGGRDRMTSMGARGAAPGQV